MNKQREIIYDQRRKVLFGEDLKGNIMEMMGDLVDNMVKPVTADSKFAEEWDISGLSENLKRLTERFPGLAYTPEEIQDLTEEKLEEDAKEIFRNLYAEKEEEIGADRMREVERMILLRVVDNKWMDHIQAMEDLKEGIGLRALGHLDPAAAYASEGFDMFEEMIGDIREDTVKYCYNVTVKTKTERRSVIGSGEGRKEDFAGDAASLARQGQNGAAAQNRSMPQQAPKPEQPRKPETVRRQGPKV